MKLIFILFCLFPAMLCIGQTDMDQLANAINTADEANTEQLKAYIWKRNSDVSIDGAVKLTTITEFSFDTDGKLQAKILDAESSVKQKRGVRGNMQEKAIEGKMDYVEKALDLALAYTFMTKGQLIDFFSKAVVTKQNGMIEATAENVYLQGDKLTIQVDAATHLYLHKKFTSLVGTDPIDGEINYEKFSSGVNHGSTTVLNMPAQKMKINALNNDYSQRIQ